MATLYKHPKTGVFYYRRVVPARLRARLKLTEFRRSLGTKDIREARRLMLAVAAECQSIFDNAGQQIVLTHMQRVALVSDWLRDANSESREDPPHPEGVAGVLSLFSADRVAGAVRYRAGTWVAHALDKLLKLRGLVNIDDESRDELYRLLAERMRSHWQDLARYNAGDYSAPAALHGAPTWADASKRVAEPIALSLLDLFDAYARERQPVRKTQDAWRSRVAAFGKFVGHTDALRVSADDVVRWKDHLVTEGTHPRTINNGPLAALRAVFSYAVENRRRADNPVSGIRARVPKRSASAKRKSYNDDEVAAILSEARKLTGWARWLPVLLAYSGMRIEEAAGAFADDVRCVSGVWFLDMNEKRRRLKNASSVRVIPLHPAVIAEGFLSYAEGLSRTGPLFPDLEPNKYGSRGSKAQRPHGKWVRSLDGIDARLQPAHAWRHRFTDLCRLSQIPQPVQIALTGHSPGSVGERYGEGFALPALLPVLAASMNRIPVQG